MKLPNLSLAFTSRLLAQSADSFSVLPNIPKKVPNAYIFSSAGVKGTPDQFHFNVGGMRELGRRYGVKMLELEGFLYDESKGPVPVEK